MLLRRRISLDIKTKFSSPKALPSSRGCAGRLYRLRDRVGSHMTMKDAGNVRAAGPVLEDGVLTVV